MIKRFLSDPPRPFFKRCGQDFVRWFLRVWLVVYHRIQIHGMYNVPVKDGMIICSNHQSNLDPIVVGCSMPRRTNYLAKESLLRNFPLGSVLRLIDTIPLDREGSISGMKETLRRLKRNESIVIFPEGTRSRDGAMLPLKPGFLALARRGKSPLLPVGVAGTMDAWPPGQMIPSPTRIAINFGAIIPVEVIRELSDEEVLALLAERISVCYEEAKQKLAHAS